MYVVTEAGNMPRRQPWPMLVYGMYSTAEEAEKCARRLVRKQNDKGYFDRTFEVYAVRPNEGEWHPVFPSVFSMWDYWNAVEESADQIERLEAALRWIPVEERLPLAGRPVEWANHKQKTVGRSLAPHWATHWRYQESDPLPTPPETRG